MDLNRKGRLHSGLLQWGEDYCDKVQDYIAEETDCFNFAETKGSRIFKCWYELMEKSWRMLVGRLVNVLAK